MKKALVITWEKYQDHELIYPYYSLMEHGFTVDIMANKVGKIWGSLGVTKTDYTTDVINEDDGIRTINVTSVSGSDSVTFTATTISTSYNFEYHVDMGTLVPPTPTPTPSITATQTPTPSNTPTNSVLPTNTPTPTNSITPTNTPTPSITPSITPSAGFNPFDGEYMIVYDVGQKVSSGVGVVYYWLSSDYGNSWTRYSQTVTAEPDPYTSTNYLDFGIDYSGQNLVASNIKGGSTPGKYFFQSNNYGVSFVQKFNYQSAYGFDYVYQTVISNDAKIIISVGDYGIYERAVLLSQDYGSTFTKVALDAISPSDLSSPNITLNQTGQYIFAGGFYNSATSGYTTNSYISTDYGSTFTNVNSAVGHGSSDIYGNISLSGQYLFVWSNGGSFTDTNTYGKLSNDYGSTFSGITINGNNYYINTVNMAGNASIIYIAAETGSNRYLYKSTDYGSTWTNIKDLTGYGITSLSTSANGKYLLLTAGDSNDVFMSNDFGATFTTVSLPSPSGPYLGSQMSRYFGPNPSPTPTPSMTMSATPSVTPTMSMTPTPSITSTITPTETVTPTPSITATFTPTMSITPTMTITPSPTPVPITLKYRYDGNAGSDVTKRTSGRNIRWGSTTYSMSFSTEWTASADTGEVTLGTSFVLSSSLTAYRSICRVSGPVTQVDSYTINIYQNGTLVNTFTNNTNTTITLCPTVISANRSFGQTFNGGDIILVEWIDNLTA